MMIFRLYFRFRGNDVFRLDSRFRGNDGGEGGMGMTVGGGRE